MFSRFAAFGDAPALITREDTVTYRDLATRVDAAASGLGPGRRLVLVEGANAVEPVVTYLAALSAGHVVLLAPGTALDAMVAAYDPDVVARADGTLTERRPGSAHTLHPDLALLMSTSGSTGSPKLVRLSHENLRANAESIATYLGVRPTDRAATTLPMHYCYGLSVINTHLLRGAALILTDLSVVDACFWSLFTEHGGTTFAGVPYTFDLLDRVRFAEMDLPRLRYVTQAGGRLDPARVRAYAALGRERGWDLVVMYGQTEATARMAYLPPALAETHPHAIGVPVPGGSFEIEAGELVYSGPNVMLGYADSPADLALGRTSDRLHTGDLARCVDGVYEVVGRRSRFAKVFGLRIDLGHVEALLARRGVTAACADADGALSVVVEGPASGVRDAVARDCGVPLRAVSVRPVDALPRLANGKVDYAAVRTAPAPPPATPPGNDLRALYAAVLERPRVTDADSFVSLGGDSLSYVELSLRVEEALGHLPPAWHVTPIRDLTPAPAAARRRALRSVETSVALRALCILLVVGTHANLLDVQGGAHVLLAVAGFNFARFHAGATRTVRNALASVARIAVPSIAWIACVTALSGQYAAPTVLLLNTFLGPRRLGPQWELWFVEAVVWTVLGMTALLAVPAVARAERRAPFAFALGLVGLGLLTRYGLVTLGAGSDPATTLHVVFWLFALGWATAKATRLRHRLIVTAAAAVTLPGFFHVPSAMRAFVVLAGLLVLLWTSTLRLPAPLVRATGVLASASLYVYLAHWQVFPHLQYRSPVLATLASFAAGLAFWRLATTAPAALVRAVHTRAGRLGASFGIYPSPGENAA